MSKGLSRRSAGGLLIFLGWLVYASSYLGKINYSANITQIMDYYNVTKAEAGIPPTFLFFSYGVGQALNGILCKKYNIKWAVFSSIIVSVTINLIIAVTDNFYIIKWLWLINGFALSVLWPTLVRMFAETLPKDCLGKSSVIMGTTVACGTLIIYALSSVYAIFGRFKLAFYTDAAVGIPVAIAWLMLYKRAADRAKNQKDKETPCSAEEVRVQNSFGGKSEKRVFLTSISTLCICAVAVNLIKDGLTTWVPSILKDEYSLSDSLSIMLTLLLPMVALLGNVFSLSVHKKIPDYVAHCFVIFIAIGCFIGAIIGCLPLGQIVVLLICLTTVNFLASSINNLITSIFPMFMRERINSGLYAGILNCFCYLGSTISSYGLGYVAQNFGWTAAFWALAAFCVLVCSACGVYFAVKRRSERELKIPDNVRHKTQGVARP